MVFNTLINRSVRYGVLLALLVAFGVGQARAQAAGAFTRMGFGARGVAMGNAIVADDSGEASPYYNPALAPFAERQNLEATVGLLSFDRQLQFLQFSTPLQNRAGMAVGLIHAGVSNIDGRDNSGFHTENLSTDEFAVFLAFGLRFGERVTGGIGLQFLRTSVLSGLKAANSVGLDFGLTVKVTQHLRLGFVVDDLLTRYEWDTSGVFGENGKTTTDRYPVRLRLGASYTLLDDRLTLVAEYESRLWKAETRTQSVRLLGDTPVQVTETTDLTVHDAQFRFGAEYRLAKMFALRGGLDRIGAGDLGGVQPTGGFMVEQPVGNLMLRGEYAFALEPFSAGTMHLIALKLFL